MTTGDRISMLRRSRDYSQEELAEMCGVSRQAVSKWESEQSLPEIEKIMSLSEIFGVTTDYILKGIEPLDELLEKKKYPAKPYNIVGTALIFLGAVFGAAAVFYDYDSSFGLGNALITFVFAVLGITAFALGSVKLPKRDQKRNTLAFLRGNIWALAFFVFSLIYNAAAVHAVAPFPLPFTDSRILRYEQTVTDAGYPRADAVELPDSDAELDAQPEPAVKESYYSSLPNWAKDTYGAAFVVLYALTCSAVTVFTTAEITRDRKSKKLAED